MAHGSEGNQSVSCEASVLGCAAPSAVALSPSAWDLPAEQLQEAGDEPEVRRLGSAKNIYARGASELRVNLQWPIQSGC